MKGVTGSPAHAYQRMAVGSVTATRPAAPQEQQVQNHDARSEAAEVTISKQARTLAAEGPGAQIDAKKVEALKSQVQAGSFQVNPTLIAQRMIDALG